MLIELIQYVCYFHKVWNCESGDTSVVCRGHSGVVRWCCFSSDGLKIASGSDDQTVKVSMVDIVIW